MLRAGRARTYQAGVSHLRLPAPRVAPRDFVARLAELEATLIGYEIIRDSHGDLPVLLPMSDMAGQMAIHIAAHYLQNTSGGRGGAAGANGDRSGRPDGPDPGAGAVGLFGRLGAALAGWRTRRHHGPQLRQTPGPEPAVFRAAGNGVGGVERLEKYTAIADVLIGAC